MKFQWRNPFCIFGIVLLWRVALLVFTAQPIPANDAFGYDGAVANFLHGGNYVNPSLAEIFPISGREIYSTYPPLYQAALFGWMKIFGTSVISAMWLHLMLFSVSGFLALTIIKKFFPANMNYTLAALFFFGFTFGDRPEDLAHLFGIASLWFVARQLSEIKRNFKTSTAITLLLLLALYTSPIVGAFYFGVGFLTFALVWMKNAQIVLFAPFLIAGILFAAITIVIKELEPRWWAGFMESARQQSVVSSGFHPPPFTDLLKLLRTAPVFVLGIAAVPFLFSRRREIFIGKKPWLLLAAGIFLMGWILIVADLVLLSANYIGYVMFTQIILAASLLALAQKFYLQRENTLRMILLACVVLVSVRAIGLTTWGAACASKNSYSKTHNVLRAELEPFKNSKTPVLISSAFLYSAAESGVKNYLNCDWYFDHATWTNHSQINALLRLKPPRMMLTQFDYYRSFITPLEELRQFPAQVEIRVRDFAKVRPPDSIPSFQRVIQHISWAPVIVDLDWKTAATNSAPAR